ncbi:MAG: hypothetical protein QXI32_01350 [Candidatus Bathyarchaeia archaeon]
MKKSDLEHSRTIMHDGTAVFVHSYEIPNVRRMVDSISREEYQEEIISPHYDSDTALIKKKDPFIISIKSTWIAISSMHD